MEFRPPKGMSFVDNISEQWKEWFQQFTIFLKASGKDDETDERKINILLNLIGSQGIKIYNNFKKPKKSTDITYDNVIKWFSDYCEPRKNIIFQRYKFGSCVQKEEQTFDDFVTELKTLSSLCEYKEEDNMIRDRIVFDIRDAETKNKLLSLDNLTLDKAETLCRTREVTVYYSVIKMNDSLEILETTKGKALAVHNGYQYRRYRTNNVNVTTCLCLNEKKREKCTGRLKTTGNTILNVTIHQCKYDSAKIKVKKKYNIAKKRVRDSSNSAAQIFREEFTPLIDQGLDLVTEISVYSSVKTTLNRICRKSLGNSLDLYHYLKKEAENSDLLYERSY